MEGRMIGRPGMLGVFTRLLLVVAVLCVAMNAFRQQEEGTEERRNLKFAGVKVGGYTVPSVIPAGVRVTIIPKEPEEEGDIPERRGPVVSYPMSNYLRCKGPCPTKKQIKEKRSESVLKGTLLGDLLDPN